MTSSPSQTPVSWAHVDSTSFLLSDAKSKWAPADTGQHTPPQLFFFSDAFLTVLALARSCSSPMSFRASVPSGACVSVSRRLQHQGNGTARISRGTMGHRPANPCWLETSWTRAASWQQALSHVQSDLMLHHSRGVTQEEPGLTLSGGVWFGHPPHYCLPSPPPPPRWLALSGGGS